MSTRVSLSTEDKSDDAMQNFPPTSSCPRPKYKLEPPLMATAHPDTGSTTTAANEP
jgi:hypothetical protein